VFILAIDDVEDSMVIARHIRLNYPELNILARARDRYHVHLLRDLGISHIWRETYLSSLGMAYRALCLLGITESHAAKSVELFRDYDEQMLAQQQRIYTDEQKVFESYKGFLNELEQLFENDAQATEAHLRQQAGSDEEDADDPQHNLDESAPNQFNAQSRDRLDIRRNEQD
jgi:glutathione-regulated potassium-efflux system protein KefB